MKIASNDNDKKAGKMKWEIKIKKKLKNTKNSDSKCVKLAKKSHQFQALCQVLEAFRPII